MSSKTVRIYTDGACIGNPGSGGWSAILLYRDRKKIISGSEPDTTNNRMELFGPIEGLRALKRACFVEIYTDSKYVRDGITKWINAWRRNGWRTSNGKPVKNMDLWTALLAETHKHEVSWNWVAGHSGDPLNEEADKVAKESANLLRN